MEPLGDTYPPEDGYRIDRGAYELPDPGLEPDELAALNLALRAVRLGDGPDAPDGTEALWKLGGVVHPDAAAAVGPAGPATTTLASVPLDPALVPLFTAVMERRTVSFGYDAGRGEQRRTVDPWRLDNQRGRWYLTGHDHDRGEERNFRLDRLTTEVELGEPADFERPFVPGPGFGRPWQFDEGEPVMAELLVDADQVHLARLQLGEVETVDHPDGSATFTVPVTSWPAFRGFVVSFLDKAELVGPPELREDLVAWVSALAAAE
jgi:predicted DNA-binding transcriptional regulator YafY